MNDKVLHFGLYFVLGSTLAWGRERSGWAVGHGLMLAVGVVYGISDEWHQSFVPGRDASFADWIADCVGVAVGYAATRRFGFGAHGGGSNQPENEDGRNDD